jgi:hypothetical protein
VLRLDPVAEEIAWFNQAGSPVLDVPIESVDSADENAYRAGISVAEEPKSLRLPRGSRLRLPLRLENLGIAAWPQAEKPGPGAYRLGAQLLDENGALLDLDFARADLPGQISPGEGCDVVLEVRLPEIARRLRLKLDLVQEGVCWFERHGSEPLVIELETTHEETDSRAPGVLSALLALESPSGAQRVAPGASIAVRLRATNEGNTRWLRTTEDGRGQVRLAGRLVADGASRDYWRAPLPADVAPGATVAVEDAFPAPSEPGRYVVELDLVDEGFAWFHDAGATPARFELTVE